MLEFNQKNLKTLSKIIEIALIEDDIINDITSDLTIADNTSCTFQINAREDLVFCGKLIIAEVFAQIKSLQKFKNCSVDLQYLCADGDFIHKNQNIILGTGDIKMILASERIILNLIQHLSSIATNTKAFICALKNPQIKIIDTRKTLPGLREIQKYAVKCGGGDNHRFNLSDLILIKDNHISACGGVAKALQSVITATPKPIKVEIECDNFNQVVEAIKYSPNIIMLDNMSHPELQKSIQEIRRNSSKIMIEISGGINLENIHNYSSYAVDFISIGSLTNSIKAVDIGLDFL